MGAWRTSLLEHYQADANTIEPTTGFLNAAALIFGDNIVVGDTLNAADTDRAVRLAASAPWLLPAGVDVRARPRQRPRPASGPSGCRTPTPSTTPSSCRRDADQARAGKRGPSDERNANSRSTGLTASKSPRHTRHPRRDRRSVVGCGPDSAVLARALLDLLPAEVWTNPDYRWLDPATKSGSILREVGSPLDGWPRRVGARPEPSAPSTSCATCCTARRDSGPRRDDPPFGVRVPRRDQRPARSSGSTRPAATCRSCPPSTTTRSNREGKASGPCQVCGAPVRLERGDTRENYAYAFIHGAYPTEEMKDMQFDVIVGQPAVPDRRPKASRPTAVTDLPALRRARDRAGAEVRCHDHPVALVHRRQGPRRASASA